MIAALHNSNLLVKFGDSGKKTTEDSQPRGLCVATVVDDTSKIEQLEKQLRDSTQANDPSIKWCDKNLHISWRILGDILGSTRDQIINQVKKVSDGFKPVKIKFDKLISCVVKDRCYVILTSTDEAANNTQGKNKKALDDSLSEIGIGKDIHRQVNPHITIAKYTISDKLPNPFKIPDDFKFEPIEIPINNVGFLESIKQENHNDTTLVDRQNLEEQV